MGSTKKTPSKAPKSATGASRSSSKVQKNPVTPSPTKARSASKVKQTFTHHLPSDEQRSKNGRVTGRSLIVWNRPRMAEKLLLHLQYECQRAKIDLPWGAIAHRLHPGSSGAAVQQHLTRLRRDLVAEGHLVPPLPQSRNTGPVDSAVRGFIRKDVDGGDKVTTRPVKFSEEIEDRRFNLPDAGDLDGDHDGEGIALPESPTPIRRGAPRTLSRPTYAGTASSGEHFEIRQPNFYGYQFNGTGISADDDRDAEQTFVSPQSSSVDSASPDSTRPSTGNIAALDPFVTPQRPNHGLAIPFVSPINSDTYPSVAASPATGLFTAGQQSFTQWGMFQAMTQMAGEDQEWNMGDIFGDDVFSFGEASM